MHYQQPSITLASSSQYRQALLNKFGIAFTAIAPNIDESALPNEDPVALVSRLAKKKAKTVAQHCDATLIIASDQVACLHDTILTKPGNAANAFIQLPQCSGQTVTFYTSLVVYNTQTKEMDIEVEPYIVGFKTLSDEQIRGYIDKEQPFACAGSFKCEGLGIALFSFLKGKDFNTLIGLPMMALSRLLAKHNIDVLTC